MKILLVHNSYRQRGGEDVVFEQERANLERAGHNVVVYHRSNSEIEPSSRLHQLRPAVCSVWSSASRRDFSRLLSRTMPDLVHVHNTFLVISPSIYGACKERGIPVVQTLHNFRWMCPAATFFRDGMVCEDCLSKGLWSSVRHSCYRDSRAATATVASGLAWHRFARTWHDYIDCYIALTSFSRSKFIAAGLQAGKIVVKPNFVHPDPGPREGAGDYAVYLGRLSVEKGLATLLRAWKRLPVSCPLRIVGDGPERASLEALAEQLRIPGVTFHGSLSREEGIAFMKGARFAIVPSVWYEGFPMVIVEAFACGTPVLCSRLGSMQELIFDGLTGLHFAAGNADDLAQKVAWAWNHPLELSEMGRRARCEYERQYTAARNYAQLMEIYENTLSRSVGTYNACPSRPAVSSHQF
jgi:glycosyltransferase involved in cell wall biosynthesis